jgi:hypothetical protein
MGLHFARFIRFICFARFILDRQQCRAVAV